MAEPQFDRGERRPLSSRQRISAEFGGHDFNHSYCKRPGPHIVTQDGVVKPTQKVSCSRRLRSEFIVKDIET
jgi:hypothetical protein